MASFMEQYKSITDNMLKGQTEQFDKLAELISQIIIHVTTVSAENKDLKTKISVLEDKVDRQNKEINKMSTIINNQISDIEQLKNNINKLTISNDRLSGENKTLRKEIELLNGEIEGYKLVLKAQQEEIERIKNGIILSMDNRNKEGRPCIPQEKIEEIRMYLHMGHSTRLVAKETGVSNSVVSKYDDRDKEVKQTSVFLKKNGDMEERR